MKFNNLIEVRDYLQAIPTERWRKEAYADLCNNRCGVGHIAEALDNSILKASDLLLSFGIYNYEIIMANDNSENPKEGTISFLNQRIYELAN